MSVCKERSGNYCIDFWCEGQRIKKSTRQKDRRQAQLMEAMYKADLVRGVITLKPKPKPELPKGFAEFTTTVFLPWFKDTHQSRPRSYRRHDTSTKPLSPIFCRQGIGRDR